MLVHTPLVPQALTGLFKAIGRPPLATSKGARASVVMRNVEGAAKVLLKVPLAMGPLVVTS